MDKAVESQVVKRFGAAQDRLVLQAADLSLETIAAMVEGESIDIAPGYQRRARWDTTKQAALIESFLLNVPIPPVYLAEEDYGTYSVIDGKQRITAIHAFMRNRLELHSLEKFTSLNGMKFEQLPRELTGALTVRPYLRAVTLLKQSDPELKYEVFARLNTGGVALNPQEIRNVAYRGPMNDLVYSLAKNKFLRSQLKIKGASSAAYNTMSDAEFVLRFLTLIESWETFSGDLRHSMDEFMRVNREPSPPELRDFGSLFETAIGACERIWRNHAFHRPVEGAWRNQTLAGLYDAQMVALAQFHPDDIDSLVSGRTKVVSATRAVFNEADFEQAVRVGTNTPSRVRLRIKRMVGLLEDLI